MDTLPKVMRLRYPHIKYGYNKSDQFFRFYNKTRPKADASDAHTIPEEMMADLFEVVTTAFVFRGDRVLLTRRAATKKRFPGEWTVPGGHLERSDFQALPKDGEYWYDVLAHALRREVREEVGLEIADIQYVENLATIHHDGAVLVLSFSARWVGGEVKLDPTECDAGRDREGICAASRE
jgi:8-oxo-dGTP pyrophosphatase MutT (NUDIX family)